MKAGNHTSRGAHHDTLCAEDIRRAAGLIDRAGYVVALAGAGLSAGSGIPTYRGSGGLWTQHGTPPLLSYQEFASDPAEWWRKRLAAEEDPSHPVYQMKQAVDLAVPNPGHLALAELERRGVLRCLITQNVDNLQNEAGSQDVLEIHGNRNRLRCLDCGLRFHRDTYAALLSDRTALADGPPLCRECGGRAQAGHRDVRRADTTGYAASLPGCGGKVRLHAAGGYFRHGEPGGAPASPRPGTRGGPHRGQPRTHLAHAMVRCRADRAPPTTFFPRC